MAHLSCVGEPTSAWSEILEEIQGPGSRTCWRCAATRPGSADWRPTPRADLSVELIRLIRERFDFCVGAACHPEVTPTPRPRQRPALRAREGRGGASFLITQLFFDNQLSFDFVEQARAAGIGVPIIPGIMPITNVSQIKTITGMCGATIPEELEQRARRARRGPEAVQSWVAVRDPRSASISWHEARPGPLLHAQPLARDTAILAGLRAAHPGRARRRRR